MGSVEWGSARVAVLAGQMRRRETSDWWTVVSGVPETVKTTVRRAGSLRLCP